VDRAVKRQLDRQLSYQVESQQLVIGAGTQKANGQAVGQAAELTGGQPLTGRRYI